jgi:serine protease AprX
MRQDRASALWGKKDGHGGSRSSALWGKSGRGAALALVVLAFSAAAGTIASPAASSSGGPLKAQVPESLLQAAAQNPGASLDVIVLGDGSESSGGLVAEILDVLDLNLFKLLQLDLKKFKLIPAVAGSLTGADVLKLASDSHILSITPDASIAALAANPQKWDNATGVNWFWGSSNYTNLTPPTIAIVDSGVDNSSGIFGSRLLRQVDLGGGNASGDDRGHGTFVASLAAGDGAYSGVAPKAKLVSLDVFNGEGGGKTSDVIRAADWILENKGAYNIKVVNFSLHASLKTTFMYDPLDKAVEKLWLAGLVVVCAAGNYAVDSQPSGVLYAPGNDPFVITVGAADVRGTVDPANDKNAPWSAYGFTPDGFSKPELGAPGRYMIGQVSPNATLKQVFPSKVLAENRMKLSGTSFAAPVVAGMAANLLAKNPGWTPDQVKGALMVSAEGVSDSTSANSLGVGEANLQDAFEVTGPPNPNLALNQYLMRDSSGRNVFDTERWKDTAEANASWSSASWSSASWSSASWSSASWSSASWSSASWSSASWSSASWSSASWSSSSYQDNANDDGDGEG